MIEPQRRPRRLRPTDVLRREHRQIERQLDTLSTQLRALGELGPRDEILDQIQQVAGFIDREMAVHHRKEEEGLFPSLAPILDQEIHLDARVADHEDLRIMNGKFRDALRECRTAADDGHFEAQMLKGYGLYIVHLVLEHLLKEDQILFLVADRYLSDGEQDEIFRRFRQIDAESV